MPSGLIALFIVLGGTALPLARPQHGRDQAAQAQRRDDGEDQERRPSRRRSSRAPPATAYEARPARRERPAPRDRRARSAPRDRRARSAPRDRRARQARLEIRGRGPGAVALRLASEEQSASDRVADRGPPRALSSRPPATGASVRRHGHPGQPFCSCRRPSERHVMAADCAPRDRLGRDSRSPTIDVSYSVGTDDTLVFVVADFRSSGDIARGFYTAVINKSNRPNGERRLSRSLRGESTEEWHVHLHGDRHPTG